MKHTLLSFTAIICTFLSFSQTWEENSILTAFDANDHDRFGLSVELYDNYAVLGSPFEGGIDFNSGAAYVYEKVMGNWQFKQKLMASDGKTDDLFGNHVRIHEENIFIGSAGGGGSIDDQIGAIYHFKLENDIWVENQKIVASNGQMWNSFGSRFSVSSNRVVVSQPDYGLTGAVYTYELIDNVWTNEQILIADDAESGDSFGLYVDIYNNTMVACALGDDYETISNSGSVYIYENILGNWEMQQKLYASNAELGLVGFGISAAIEENLLIVGSFASTSTDLYRPGSAYVFDLEGNEWVEKQHLIPALEIEKDKFGSNVSLNGNMVIIGSNSSNFDNPVAGRALIFEFEGDDWIEKQTLQATNGSEQDRFGSSTSIWGDNIIVGAFYHDLAGTNAGAAFIYEYSTVIGIKEVDVDSLVAVHPNPANEKFIITTKDRMVDLQVISIDGKTVFERKNVPNQSQLTIDNLNSGLYIIRIRDNETNKGLNDLYLKVVVN